MKKLITSMFFVFALAGLSFGQYYVVPNVLAGENPNNINQEDAEYPAGGSGLPADWTVILGPNQLSPIFTSPQSIPFNFEFNGNVVSQYLASSTGVVTFDITATAAPAQASVALPDASVPDNSVCVLGISGAGANDNIATKTFGTAPNRQHWIFFTSFSAAGTGWTYWSIVLEETTNNIYIVDQRTDGAVSLSAGIQIDATTAVSVPGSPSLGSNSSNAPDRSDNSFYSFIYGTQPQYDLAGKSVDMDNFLILADAPYSVTGTLTNFGSETITSFDINYEVNGGTAVTDNISGVSIAPFAEYQFTAPSTWNPSATGAYTIDIYATNINGNADENTSNDVVGGTVTVVDQFTTRLPLYEIFTSSTCGPCRPGNENFHSVVDNDKGNFVEIKFQQNFPGSGDPYGTTEAVNRRSYYAINSIPRMEIDGGWDQNASSFNAQLHEDSKDVPSFLVLNSEFEVDETSQTVSIDIDWEAYADFPSSSNVLQVAIVEKLTTANVKSNGETEFYYVMKKMLPDENGTTLGAISSGATDTRSFDYTFQGNYRLPNSYADQIDHSSEHSVEDLTDLAVVAWVQDNATKEVFQSVNSTFKGMVSTEELAKENSELSVFPNPTNGNLFVNLNTTTSGVTNIIVFDPIGKVVATESYNTSMGNQTLELNLAGNAAGMYFIQIEENENISTQKFYITE